MTLSWRAGPRMSSTLRDDPGFGDGSDRAFSRRRFVGDREILRKVPDLQATSHNHHYRALIQE
jgi:hypothetical protein